MWRVLSQQAALLERFHDERDVALFEIPNPPVHQLGAAARRALAKIVLFEEQDLVATAGGINGNADAGGTAADDDDVPRAAALLEPYDHLGPEHQRLRAFEHFTRAF